MTMAIILKYFYHGITTAPETGGRKDLYSAMCIPMKINKATKLNE